VIDVIRLANEWGIDTRPLGLRAFVTQAVSSDESGCAGAFKNLHLGGLIAIEWCIEVHHRSRVNREGKEEACLFW
jgi:hypothetical protein